MKWTVGGHQLLPHQADRKVMGWMLPAEERSVEAVTASATLVIKVIAVRFAAVREGAGCVGNSPV